MTNPALASGLTHDLTNRSHDLVEQAAALAHAIVPEVATVSEATQLVDLVVTLDVELRFSACPLLAHASLKRIIDVVSELYGRVHFGHAAGAHALTVVSSAENLAHSLRLHDATKRASAVTPFRRVRREDCTAIAC